MTRIALADTLTPQRPPRRVLGALDANANANRVPTTKSNSTATTPLKTQDKKKEPKSPFYYNILNSPAYKARAPIYTLPSVDAKEEEEEEEELDTSVSSHNFSPEEQFHYVCLSRCPDDNDTNDYDGLEPWSLNDFEILAELGEGGSATVFRARERQSGYQVALKVQEASDDGLCEIDIHTELEHPSIVRMYDSFYSEEPVVYKPPFDYEEDHLSEEKTPDEDDTPKAYLIMILELCEEALFDAIRLDPKRYISEPQAALYFQDMFDAMDYLHAQEIIHCDVKTLNFLTTVDGDLKLADFGMAVRDDEKEVVGGSPIYMAPEHLMAWRKFTDKFDYRSDIYSLGVVLYETVVGYLPYRVIEKDGDSILLEDGICDEPILDLRRLDDASAEEAIYVPPPIFPEFVSDEAQDLIMRLMEPLPEDRISLEEAKEHPWFRLHGM